MENNINDSHNELYGVYSDNNLEKVKSPLKKNNPYKYWLKVSIILGIFAFIGLALATTKTISGQNDQANNNWLTNFSIVSNIQKLTGLGEKKLNGEDRGRVNILLLGLGGKGHDGGELTDTIMLLSIDTTNKRIAMVSVPRDLTVPIEGYGWRKINSVNAFAEKDHPGTGGAAISQAFTQIFNTPIDYYVKIDFEGFAKFIDDLGGVDVTVDNVLDDYKYPILGQEDNPSYYSRWEHLHVEPGLQHMDGALALKFARSRHGLGNEGSDFARAKRQQKIIEATKDKLLSSGLLLKPALISKMIDNYKTHSETNLTITNMMRAWTLLKDVKREQIVNKVLDNSPDGLLTDDRGQDGAYILVPRAGNFSEVQNLMANIFDEIPAKLTIDVTAEKANIAVKNGTKISGLATRFSTDLKSHGLIIADISNASLRTSTTTIVYDLSNAQKPETLNFLKNQYNQVSVELPNWLKKDLETDKNYTNNYQQPDFIIVIGKDATTTK
ncbi:MAG: LCP family protein [bacterium]